MKRIVLALAVAAIALFVHEVRAQQQPAAVQLPTYSFFSTGTTVTVPDRGSVLLGGVKRSATGTSEFGIPLTPFRNRAFGMERSAIGTSVSVYIHDFEALEEQLLSQSTAGGYAHGPSPRAATWLGGEPWSAGRGASTAARPAPSVTQLQAVHAAEQAAWQESWKKDAGFYYERGQRAEQSGKPNVARIYYQMAARRADEPLKAEILARLAALESTSPAARVARTAPLP